MNKIEIPYDYQRVKVLISSFGSLTIVLLIYLFDYLITHNKITFNIFYFTLVCCVFLLSVYYTVKSIDILMKKKPCIIFDEEKITSCSIFGKYSVNVEYLKGYKLVEFNGFNYVNIYPKKYEVFKKELGFHLMRRLIFYRIKKNGFEGIMISLFTLSTNYQSAMDYLNNVFESNDI